jgi:hypothetical protein
MKTEKQIRDQLDHYNKIKDNHYSGSFWIKQQVEAYTTGIIHTLEWVLKEEK